MRTITFAEALVEAQREEMRRDAGVFLIGEDIGYSNGSFGATAGLWREFGPQRVLDTPISEAAIMGAATGAAIAGMRPVVEMMYLEFLPYIDALVNLVAKLHLMSGGQVRVPLVLRGPLGAKSGNGAQHSQHFEAWFAHMPGLLVAMPSLPYDAKGLLKTAIRDDNPVVFIEDKTSYFLQGEVPEEEYTLPFGQADVKREGRQVTLIATGITVPRALRAAERLADDGIDVEVVDPRTLVPLDMATIAASVRKTGRAVVAHQAPLTGGFGGELVARIQEDVFDWLDAPVVRVAGLDTPAPYNVALEKQALVQEADIIAGVRRVLR
ncbi:MAG: alpha-ketoacid dehydrogenase subunit beta [Chloroflexota bacterium]